MIIKHVVLLLECRMDVVLYQRLFVARIKEPVVHMDLFASSMERFVYRVIKYQRWRPFVLLREHG